jgi:hypothetical protein
MANILTANMVNVAPFDGLVEMLQTFRSRKLQMAIVTGLTAPNQTQKAFCWQQRSVAYARPKQLWLVIAQMIFLQARTLAQDIPWVLRIGMAARPI